MTRFLSHNWAYDPTLCLHRCEGAPVGAVKSADRCYGCGREVTDEELHRFTGGDPGVTRLASLNWLADWRFEFVP
jgi:hypothetical protein